MKRSRPVRTQIVTIGSIFGRLEVVEKAKPNKHGQAVWLCRCQCGTKKLVRETSLKIGATSSCGCWRKEIEPTIRLVHGDKPKRKAAPEYTAWTNMITRCTNPKHNRWHRYGGRGITVCQRWRDSYRDFLTDVGRRPGPEYSLDRYPDCDGNYEPGNVRWATDVEQRMNQQRMKVA